MSSLAYYSSLTVLFLAEALLLVALGWALRGEPPPAVAPEGRVVRMLDVTIRDSNTTNRRQRFICEPASR